jgi:hypothetical protein
MRWYAPAPLLSLLTALTCVAIFLKVRQGVRQPELRRVRTPGRSCARDRTTDRTLEIHDGKRACP